MIYLILDSTLDSVDVINLLKCPHASLVCDRVMLPAKAYLPALGIINLSPIPPHADCVYMVDFSGHPTDSAFFVNQAEIKVFAYVI